MEIISMKLDEVIPYARNPRHNTDAIDKVAASIREFGFRQPIVVDANMVIVVGHTRYLAAKKLKLATVPVHVAQDLTTIKAKAYRIADNRTHDEATWDEELLALELGELDDDKTGLDIKLTGFDAKEIAQYLNVEIEPETESGDDDRNGNYKEQYGVIVVCEDEAQQENVFNKLTADGYNCRVVVT